MTPDQKGFSFDKEIPSKKFADDPTPPHKLHRKADPETSKEAAHSVNATKLEERVLDAVRSFGSTPCIGDEVRTV